jgi:1-phosphatidylinositol phosphodiesterase
MPLDLANWMSSVDGSKRVSELSIPGTHDSASRYIDPTEHHLDLSPRLTTQTAGIREQLDSGIRFLDIRVGYTDNAFKLYHEDVYLNLAFGPVRDVCKDFLDAHPGETIILSLKKESQAPTDGNDNNVTFQDRFSAYVDQNPGLWYLDNRIPKLGGARGKIVLFRRFAFQPVDEETLGINAFDHFPEDKTTTIGLLDPKGAATAQKLVIQDEFDQTRAETTKASKWTAVKDLLDDAKRDGAEETLYLNFGSAAGVVPVDFPLSVANYINPHFLGYFAANPSGRFGIVAMDFQTTQLNRAIVQTNGLG